MAEQLDLRWSNKAGHVAYVQSVSVDKIAEMAAILDTELGVAPLVLESYKEHDYDQAYKLQSIANWLEEVVDALYPQYATVKVDKLAADEAARAKAEAEAAKATVAQQKVDAKLLAMSEDELIRYASTKGLGFSPGTLPETMVEAIHAHEQRLEAAKVEAAKVEADDRAADVAKLAADKANKAANETTEHGTEADSLADDDDQTPEDAPEHDSVYGGMTKKELKMLANDRGVNIEGLRSNADIIDALQAADTKSE